jgi:hypothetical protein
MAKDLSEGVRGQIIALTYVTHSDKLLQNDRSVKR